MKKIVFIFAVLFIISFFYIKSASGACLNLTGYNNHTINQSYTLCAGTYYMNVSGTNPALFINHSNIVLDCNGSAIIGNGTGIAVELNRLAIMNNITIKNCIFQNFTGGIYGGYFVVGAVGAGNDLIIYNNIISLASTSDYGIFINSPSGNYGNFNISNNNITNCGAWPLAVENYALGGVITGNNISNNDAHAIFLYKTNNTKIELNILSENDDGSGIVTKDGCYGIRIYNNTISDNKKYSLQQGRGISLDGGTYDIQDNNITNNDRDGIYAENAVLNITGNNVLDNGYRGIHLKQINNSILYLNLINNSDLDGIRLESCHNNNLTNITSTYNDDGLRFYSNNTGNRIINCTLTNSGEDYVGLYIDDATSCSNIITNNTAGNNGELLKFFNDTATLSDQNVGQLVICGASDSSFTNLTMINSDGVWVIGNSSNNNLTSLNISTDDYYNIMLSSSSSDFCIINSTTTGGTVGMSISGDNHLVRNCTIDAATLRGITFTGGTGNIVENSTVKNSADIAIAISSSNNATIRHSTIENSSSYGIRLYSTSSNACLYDNTIIAANDFGIYDSADSTNISYNTIYNITNSSASDTAFGIYGEGSSSLTISDNDIYSCDKGGADACGGIVMLVSNGTLQNNNIHDFTNTSCAMQWGIYYGYNKGEHLTLSGNNITNIGGSSWGYVIVAAGAGDNSNITSSDNRIINTTWAIFAADGNITLDGVTITGSAEYDAYSWDADLHLINLSSINTTKLNASDTGNVSVYWHVRARVQTTGGSNISGATVSLTGTVGAQQWSKTTGADGYTSYGTARQYLQTNVSGTDYNPFTATASKTGYVTNSNTTNVTGTTITVVLSEEEDNGGNGGGTTTSGRSGGGMVVTKIILETEPITSTLQIVDKVIFTLNETTYYVQIKKIHTDHVTMTIYSPSFAVDIDLYANKTEKADVNNDSILDIAMTLGEIYTSSAKITFERIEEALAGEPAPVEEALPSEEEIIPPELPKTKSNWPLITAIIAAAAIVCILIRIRRKKSSRISWNNSC